MKKIISIVGARPQFIKHAPVQMQLQKRFNALTIHTGQHYDANMSTVFFDELGIPKPDFLFEAGGGKPHGEQTGIMMTEIEKVCFSEKPDGLLVYGDTNSTLAGALVAAKLQLPLVHIEAGLRSYNRSMPEEINRIVADEFASLLFCPTPQAVANLKKEGIDHSGIFLCGDVMCDMIHLMSPRVKPLVEGCYYFVTIHRPYNTDDMDRMVRILTILNSLKHPVIFSIHPRTSNRLETFGVNLNNYRNIRFIAPLSYSDSVAYQKYATCVITDSGGVQKEAYILQKQCITLRSETEWSETLEHGWNALVFEELEKIQQILETQPGFYNPTLYGDGHAAEEIITLIAQHL